MNNFALQLTLMGQHFESYPMFFCTSGSQLGKVGNRASVVSTATTQLNQTPVCYATSEYELALTHGAPRKGTPGRIT
jgi:hypothetical protein